MKKNAVGWFEIYVEDMSRAKKFYESVFERKLEKLESPEIEMWSFFSCDDCSKEEKRVQEFGGRIQKTKFSIGHYGFISLVFDTEGNMFGLHSMK